ncbi:MAG: hypothetical protein M1828_001553 [Chrysothrix sp. TS-e1954]|nr:MAG: hypothetical protein M1828_001553 [Chrysothrix sp. TS-e1954]
MGSTPDTVPISELHSRSAFSSRRSEHTHRFDDIDAPPVYEDTAYAPLLHTIRTTPRPNPVSAWATTHIRCIIGAFHDMPLATALPWVLKEYPVSYFKRREGLPTLPTGPPPDMVTPTRGKLLDLLAIYDPETIDPEALTDDTDDVLSCIVWSLTHILLELDRQTRIIFAALDNTLSNEAFLRWLGDVYALPPLKHCVRYPGCKEPYCRKMELARHMLRCLRSWRFRALPGAEGAVVQLIKGLVKNVIQMEGDGVGDILERGLRVLKTKSTNALLGVPGHALYREE